MARRRPEPARGDIVDLTHDGRGVAMAAGKRVFVSDALAGERVDYQVVRKKRSYDEARTLAVVEPAAERVEPRCAVFGVCGGCTLQHLEHEAQLAHKQNVLVENLRRIGELTDIPLAAPLRGPVWHYRRRARLGVKSVHGKGRVLVGFRERGKPYITDMQRCEVLSEPLATLPGVLAELVDTLDARARLPQVEVTQADSATALVFRCLDDLSAADLDRLAAFHRASAYEVYLQTGGPDTVTPLAAHRADLGEPVPLTYRLPDFDLTFEFQPLDFIQINREINATLIRTAVEALDVSAESQILDLYCGIGNFSLPLARRGGTVIGVEGLASLTARASANAARNGLDNVRFETLDLDTVTGAEPWLGAPIDRVLLDPARAGAEAMMPLLGRLRPERIVYVSCHPGTLARDVGMLVRDAGYRLIEARIADMFPHTAHVETLAVLEAPS